jgi:hypothetical protein
MSQKKKKKITIKNKKIKKPLHTHRIRVNPAAISRFAAVVAISRSIG